VAYAVSLLLALPYRAEANARLDEFVQRGEVAMMRESLKP